MKAIRVHEFGEPAVLKLEDIPTPRPTSEQVVVGVKAIGVNPVDTYIRAGKYGPRQFPFTPGFDAAGIVQAIGSDVKNIKPGDRVYVHRSLSGTYAEAVLCEAAQVHPLPDRVTFEAGAALGVPYLTAYYGLVLHGNAKSGETVFIHGASGGVGTAAIQFSRMLHLHIIGTGGTEKGREHILQQGAEHALDHRAANYLDELMKITEGRGADVILEMAAHANLGKDLKVLSKSGRVVVIGSRGPVEIEPRDLMSRNGTNLGSVELECHSRRLSRVPCRHRQWIAAGGFKTGGRKKVCVGPGY